MPTAPTDALSQRSLTALAVSGALAMILQLVAPRTGPGVLALLLLSVVIARDGTLAWPASLRELPPALWLAVALCGWSLVSALWAVDRVEALAKSATLLAFALAVWWTQCMLPGARVEALRHVARAALFAFAAGLVYLCVEELSGHVLKRALFFALPFTRPPARHVVATEDALHISTYLTNRNMAAGTLLLWPMLLLLASVVDRARRLPAMAALVVLVLTTTLRSEHETSVLALAVSAVVFALFHLSRRIGIGALAAGWAAACLAVVPAANWALKSAELHKAEWLPHSARHRVVLWGYTAEHYPQSPLVGIGAASTRVIDIRRGVDVETYQGTRYQWRSGPHAHNIYLQTWYELGAVGATLLCAFGIALIAALRRLPGPAVPFAAATFACAAVMGGLTWGLWQAWFLAAFAVATVAMALAARIAGESDETQQGVARLRA